MNIRREFLIGVLVVVSVVLLYFGLSYLKGVNLLQKQQKFYGVYDNAAGLQASNPVILNGYKIGIVKAVHLHENGSGKIVVEVLLRDANLQIPSDTKLEIYDADLFGGKAIQLMLGTSPNLAENKDTLQTGISLGLAESVKQEIEPLKQKTTQLFASVDTLMTNIRKVLSSEQTEDLGEIFSSLKNTLRNLERTSAELNGTLANNRGKLSNIFDNVESISNNLKDNNDELSNAIRNASLITDSIAKLNLAGTLTQVNTALNGVNEITKSINEGDGTLTKLLQSDSLHNQVVSASHSLDLLLNDMRTNPKRYLSFSVIGRKESSTEFSKSELEQIRLEIDNYLKNKR
jgi:phospholipid/cholesterol/gamma-HCH transport system substrate-binding protein